MRVSLADWNDGWSAGESPRRSRHAGSRTVRLHQTRSLRKRRGWAAGVATATAAGLVAAGLVLSSGPVSPASQTAALAAWRTPSIGTVFGSSVSSGDLALKTKAFGHMPIIRTAYSGLPAANAWTTGPGARNNSAVIVSFAAPPSTVLAGADDAVLTRFFDTAPSGHRIYYAYYSEPEGNVSRHQFTTSLYRRAWLHIAALARKARNRQLTPTLILRASDLSARSGVNWRSYLPDRHVIRTIAWDAFPAGTLTGHDPQLTAPATFMGPAIAAAKSAGMQFGFAGFALATAKGQAWLKTVANYLKNSGALFGLLTSRAAVPATELTDRPSIKAWHSVVSRSGTVQGPTSPAPLPSAPSPTPTPTTPAPSSPTPSAPAPSSPTSSSPAPSSPPSTPPAPSSPPSTPPAPPGPVVSPITSVPTGNVTCNYGPDTWSGDASGVGYSVREIQATNGDLASFAVALNANKGTTEVVGYPSDQCLMYSALPSMLTSSFDVTPPANSSGLDYEYAYDIWLTTAAAATSNNWNNDLELMIWTYVNGQVPAGSVAATLSDGSKVWVAGNNTNGTVSVVLPKNETIGTVDIASIVSQLKARGYVTSADTGILDVEYGIEAPYGGGQTFAVNGFSVSAKS